MTLQESGEMYLETILILTEKQKYVHAIHVGEYMGFSKPSVSRALARLKKGGYITVDEVSHIHFTPEGREIAEKIYEKHTLLTKYIMLLGVSEETAKKDACRIEHVISDETFDAMKRHAAEHNA